MKYFRISIALFLFVLAFGTTVTAAACDEEPVRGVYYTSSFCWSNTSPYSDGSIGSIHNDTKRLQRALDKAVGKLVFDEAVYFINDDLLIKHSFLIIEGTGRGLFNPNPSHSATPTPTPTPASTPYPGPGASPVADNPDLNKSTRIMQTATNKSIFKIAEDILAVSIRDLALLAESRTGTTGILMEGGPTASGYPSVVNRPGIAFQFSNLTFNTFHKGIYVNGKRLVANDDPDTTGLWQADNVRLDHAWFVNCDIGVHLNSNNSGWSMTSLDFNVPSDDLSGDGVENETWGIYMERSTYTNMSLLIGNGIKEGVKPTGFIRVERHANVTIQNATDEPASFGKSLWVGRGNSAGVGGDINNPVNVSNCHLGNEVRIDNSTYISTANQYGTLAAIPVNANGVSQIHSFGDKFCFEGITCTISGTDYSNFKINDDSWLKSSFGKRNYLGERTTVKAGWEYDEPLLQAISSNFAGASLFRIGISSGFYYDFTRNDGDGALEINGNQTCCNMIRLKTGASAQVQINTDGSVTYGSVAFANLSTGASVGTVVYCSNCTKATPCASGGSGAMAKKVNGASPIWDCD